jgi:phosphoribosylformylglycinamidine synthase subunit PurL
LDATLKSFNLTKSEYQKITTHLQRDPNLCELAMFSVLWSEHCCYKNSKHLLKKLPTTGKRVLQGPGENAGVVSFGEGLDGQTLQVAFKIESHNHPTAVEPYQGAATGVGGILRDIFTMNARPVANLNALRFGPLSASETTTDTQASRNRYLFTHAVKGIGDYGNCVGVPTIAGDVFFDQTYTGNPLVNAMSIGLLEGPLVASGASGVGNPILYVGSATGRDGMGGAAFASKELDENSHEDRPAVQVGDPFSEKLLIEACLEAFKTGCVVAAQDMGAAGLTSSSCEMASKGNVGMRMDLDKVPAREPGMLDVEFMLSESQERMLFVLDKDRIQPVLDVFAKWHVPAVIIGEVIAEPNVEIMHHGQLVVNIPAKLLTDLAPSYDRGVQPEEPEAFKTRRESNPQEGLPVLDWADVPAVCERLLATPNIAQASPVFTQYDRHVQNNTLLASEANTSGVIRLRQQDGRFSGKALAATVDCNPVYVALNPYQGAMGAVVEAARNLACVGAEPVAVTDNLNFGNPEKPTFTTSYFTL